MGLWATIHACEAELENSGFSYQYSIAANGLDEALPVNTQKLVYGLRAQKKLAGFIEHTAPLAPPTARQLATEGMTGDYLFFFDNHCIPMRGYFEHAIGTMQELGADMLHSSTVYSQGIATLYHYRLTLRDNFWVGEESPAPQGMEPYRVAIAGHGGFVVRRSVWEEVGGYGPIGMFNGWGGEESYFDLKMGLFGKQVWIDPLLRHFHYASERVYARHHSDDFFRNMLVSARVIGGESWFDTVYTSFLTGTHQPKIPFPTLREQAIRLSASHAKWVEEHRQMTLDELLEFYKAHNVAQ